LDDYQAKWETSNTTDMIVTLTVNHSETTGLQKCLCLSLGFLGCCG
jgi:hypothetical protein